MRLRNVSTSVRAVLLFAPRCAALALLTSCIGSTLASPIVITSTVGDLDALGTGTLPGGTLPAGPFDNRSAAELLASDGSELTDRATASGGFASDATFRHTTGLGTGRMVVSAFLELGIGGLQSNDADPETSGLGEDALFINGARVPEAFAGVDQGRQGYGILTITLPVAYLSLLHADTVEVFVDLNSNAGFGPSSRVEPVFYDFSRLTITTVSEGEFFVPEPATAWLMVTGAALLFVRKHKQGRA